MKVGIFINTTKPEANKTANEFSDLLFDNGIESKVVNLKEDCKDVDLIAIFGGDGTILRVVEYAIEYDLPLLAINSGTVGFLTTLESKDLQKAINLIKNGGPIEKRSVMKVYVDGNKYYALNEALVERVHSGGYTGGVAKLELTLGGQKAGDYSCDGLIISTPTGSTAYSLSAGGSVIAPNLNVFSATPVCSHSAQSKPIIYSDDTVAKIKLLPSSVKCALYVDGKFIKNLKVTDTVEVNKSKKQIKFFSSDSNFYEKLLLKLNKWSEIK